jgi:hypothetical protein
MRLYGGRVKLTTFISPEIHERLRKDAIRTMVENDSSQVSVGGIVSQIVDMYYAAVDDAEAAVKAAKPKKTKKK